MCSGTYIGQTGRQIIKRCREHFRKSQNSEFRNHLDEAGHHEGKHEVMVLHTQKKGKGLDALETLEIRMEKFGNPACTNKITDVGAAEILDFIPIASLLELPVSRPPTTSVCRQSDR